VPNPARALVIGSTGHIGSHVVRALLAEGTAVRAWHRSTPRLDTLAGLDVERVQGDTADRAQLTAALRGCAWLFQCGGYYPFGQQPRDAAVQAGVQNVRDVLEAARAAAVERVVFTSSAATNRRVAGRAGTEADAEPYPPSAPRSLYATVKIAMEQEALRFAREGLPVVFLNPSVCLGEYDTKPFSGLMLFPVAKWRLPVYLQHQFSAVYTGDVGRAAVAAARRGRQAERYLLAAQNVTYLDFTRLVARLAGVRPPWLPVPYPVAWATAAVTELIGRLTRTPPAIPLHAVVATKHRETLDGSKVMRELGLIYTPLDEAIRRALAWFRQVGLLPSR